MRQATAATNDPTTGTAKSLRPAEIARQFERERAHARAARLASLDVGALYIILFHREGTADESHWALYHHVSATEGGWKYHITGSRNMWSPDHGLVADAVDSMLVLGLVRITAIDPGPAHLGTVNGIVTAEDERLETIEPLTCRIYISRVCERLKSRGLLKFADWGLWRPKCLRSATSILQKC